MEPFQKKKEESNLRLVSWEERWPELVAGFSTRNQGKSSAPYTGLNCGLHVGDEKERVIANREILASHTGFPYDVWTCAEQSHGKGVKVIELQDIGAGRFSHEEAIKDIDGLLTDKHGVLLTSFYADCVPIFFYAPKVQVVGIAHAGWKGTTLKIVEEMLRKMERNWQIAPEDVYTAIGPSIHSCCYEVNDLVIEKVKEALGEEVENVLTPIKGNKGMLNLQETNRILLEKAGVLPQHIEVSQLCTGCRTDLFFSHRKEGGKTGRMAAFIGLKEV